MRAQRGKFMIGQVVSDVKFQGVSNLDELQDFGLERPTLLEHTTFRALRKDKDGTAAKELRESVQRRFDKKRMRRAEVYSAYIEMVERDGKEGGTPAITLWSPDHLRFDEARGLEMPPLGMLIAIDGETQTEARFILRDRLPETGLTDIAVTVYHGVSAEHARQILHDYNKYATPISESENASLNKTGPLSQAVRDVAKLAQVEPTRLNHRSPVPGKKELVSYQQIMSAITGMMMGSQAMTSSSSRWYSALNAPTSAQIPSTKVVETVASFVSTSFGDDSIRKASPAIWQIAGVLKARGVVQLDWHAGIDTYHSTRSTGRGGSRMPLKDRLAMVAKAMGDLPKAA